MCCQKQYIEPKADFTAIPVDERNNYRQRKYQPHRQHRAKRKAWRFLQFAGRFPNLFFPNKRFYSSIGIFQRRIFHEVVIARRHKHLVSIVQRTVNFATQHQVNTQFDPWRRSRVAVDDVAKRQLVCIRRIGDTHLSHRTLKSIAGTGRAIVVEEVVAIKLVLGSAVPNNQSKKHLLLLWRQVQFLLPHRVSLIDIARHEEVRRFCPEFIVGLALHKAPDEVLRAVIKQPVVKHKVETLQFRIPHVNGSVSKQGIRLSSRRAS